MVPFFAVNVPDFAKRNKIAGISGRPMRIFEAGYDAALDFNLKRAFFVAQACVMLLRPNKTALNRF